MVKQVLQLDQVFHALSDPTRREILLRISSDPDLTVSEISQAYSMSTPAISKHLRVLEKAGLIKRYRSGKEHTFTLSPKPLQTIEAYLAYYTTFWSNSPKA